MKKLIVASSVLATSVAFAGDYKINVEGRSDLIMSTTKTTAQAGTTDEDKETSFKNNIVRLNMLGTVNDNLTYRFRYRFTKNETDTTRDTASDMLDYLYVDHKNSYFTTRFGKQNWSETYGRESFVAGSDVILSSAVKANHNTDVGEYRFGVSAKFKILENQNLTVFVSNPNKALTASTGNAKNNSVAYGVACNSTWMDKLIQPVWSVTIAPQDGDKEAAAGARTKTANNTLYALGLRSEFSNVTLDADYKQYTKANRNDGTNTAAVKETTKSMFFSAAYAMNEFTPFFQYVNDKFTKENTAASDYKKNQFAVGVMYKPFADVNFRYHAVYTNSSQKFDSTLATNKEVKANNIIFGIKADI